MVIVKIKRDISGENRYLKNAVRYVHDKKGVPPIFLSGNGVDYTSAQKAFDQMYAVKQYFGKTSGNPLVHFMICFDKSVTTADIATRLPRNPNAAHPSCRATRALRTVSTTHRTKSLRPL